MTGFTPIHVDSDELAVLLAEMGADPLRDRSGPWWSARCIHPTHHDDTPSMRFRDGDQAARLIVHCHGCNPTAAGKSTWLREVLEAAREGRPLPPASPSKKRGAGGGTPAGTVAAEYLYRDAAGKAVAKRIRYTDPKDFRWARPMPVDGRTTWPAGLGHGTAHDLPLYRLLELLADTDGDVWIVEGEKDADRLASLGRVATCSPAGSAGPPRDLSALTGRTVRYVLDRDKSGVESARRWTSALDCVAATVRVFAPVPGHTGADVSDHLDAGHDLDQLVEVRLDADRVRPVGEPAPEPDPGAGRGETGKQDKPPSARDALVALAEQEFRIGRTVDGRVFIVPNTGRNVALFGGEAKNTLASLLYKREHRAPGRSPLDEAWNVIQGIALEAVEERLPLRVAVAPDCALIIDLGTVDGRCIRITPGRWTVEPRSPVTFKRTKVTSPLPEPVRGGTIDPLWDIVNVNPAHRDILRAKLASDLFRDIPHPIVNLRGEQGAAKTTATWVLTSIVDPSAVQTLSPPRDSDSWQTTANARWVIPVDNVSKIDRWWSDDLCRTATGAGDLKRSLYTDDDVVARITRGCVVLNGISLSSALRNDLAERMLAFDLHRPTKYKTEAQVLADFQHIHPQVLGAVLDDAAKVLAAMATTKAPTDLRMADFAHVLAAFDKTYKTKVLGTYRDMHDEAAAEALESDPIARTILKWMEHRSEWTGTAADLLSHLKTIRQTLIVANELPGDGAGSYWPTDATRLSSALTRSGALLAQHHVTYRRERTDAGRTIALSKRPDADHDAEKHAEQDQRHENHAQHDADDANDAESPQLVCFTKEEPERPPDRQPTGKHTSRGSSVISVMPSTWDTERCAHGVPGGSDPDPLLNDEIPCRLCRESTQGASA